MAAINRRKEFYALDNDISDETKHHSTQTLVYDDHIKLSNPEIAEPRDEIDPRKYSAQTTLTCPITGFMTYTCSKTQATATADPAQWSIQTNAIPSYWWDPTTPSGENMNSILSSHWEWRQIYRNYTITAAELEIALIFRPYDSLDYVYRPTQTSAVRWGDPNTATANNWRLDANASRPDQHQPASGLDYYAWNYATGGAQNDDFYPNITTQSFYGRSYNWDTPLATTLSSWKNGASEDWVVKQTPCWYAGTVRAPQKVTTVAPNDTNIGIIRKRGLMCTRTIPDWQERTVPYWTANLQGNYYCYDYRNKTNTTPAFTWNNAEYDNTVAKTVPRNNEMQIWHHNLYANHKALASDTNYIDAKENIGTCDYWDYEAKAIVHGTKPTDSIYMTVTAEQPIGSGTNYLYPGPYWDFTADNTSHYIEIMILGRLTQWITYFNPRPSPMSKDIPVI